MRPSLRISALVRVAACATSAACAFTAGTAHAAAICGEGIYSYAGYSGRAVADGVSATIEQAGPLFVRSGHVAGWIGVVDPLTGRAWLQVGLSALPGQSTSEVYVEFAAPGRSPVYKQLASGIIAGEPHSFAVYEQPGSPGTWVVWVDGRVVGPPLHLRGSHRRWTAQVLGESWAGATSGACNAYSYAFSGVHVLRPGRRPAAISSGLAADPDYAVADPTSSGFVATSLGVAGFRSSAVQPPQRPRSSSQ